MASTKTEEHNLDTLQLLLQRIPECNTPQSRSALLSLVYLEARPIAIILIYSILKKKSFYRNDILDIVHDACTKLVMQFSRSTFVMKSVRSYMYLMVLGAIYPHSDKVYAQHTQEFPETDDNLAPELCTQPRLFCDSAHIEESMYEDLDYYHCTEKFVAIVTTVPSLRRAIRLVKNMLPKEFFYRHWGAIYSLWYLSYYNRTNQ